MSTLLPGGLRRFRGGKDAIRSVVDSAVETFLPGIAHRRRLSSIDAKIVVSGTRGKSSLTRWVYDTLSDRGLDVYAKVTGNRPVSLYRGQEHPIERGKEVRLYENEREIREHTPEDAMVLENQAISSYTNRIVNEFFARADVVVLTNVREDHLSTLGDDRYKIARSLVRSIPSGTHVINGERDRRLRVYLDREIRRRGATVSHVTVPPGSAHVPGIESVYALNHVLTAIGQPPLDEASLASYRERMRVEWTVLPNGRVFNAAEVNDVQSTEMVREALTGDADPTIQPFVYLRGDRRGRTVSFLHYLRELADRDERIFETVHVAGEMASVFARKAPFPVIVHDRETETAGSVLDDLLSKGYPVVLMGNTVAEFMREMEAEIDRRAEQGHDRHDAERSRDSAVDRPRRPVREKPEVSSVND